MELIKQLGIDWRLLLAQIVNFFIILFVLHRFAYKPVMAALERRTKKIEQGLRDAKAMEEERAQLAKEVERNLQAAARQGQEIVASAESAAKQLKEELLVQAKQEAGQLAKRTQEQLAAERVRVLDAVRGEVADLVVATTERVLTARLDATERKRLLENAVKELER